MSARATFKRRIRAALGALVAGGVIAACSGEDELRCAGDGDYATSTSAPPVRVPDDLSVPEESSALRVPPDGAGTNDAESSSSGCLERPPDYFEGGEPQGADG